MIGDKSSRIKKTVSVSRDLYLETDYEILRSLLLNLVKNSIEAISDDGTIEISARKDGKRVSISVRDTGIGVPEEYVSKIWQPYYTTKPSGTGLGLPIALKFAEAIGCELELDSDSNGTTVTLIFGGDDEGKNTTG